MHSKFLQKVLNIISIQIFRGNNKENKERGETRARQGTKRIFNVSRCTGDILGQKAAERAHFASIVSENILLD